MRLFIAVDIPAWAKKQLEQLQDPDLGVRWLSPDTMHLTLRFIGDLEEASKREHLIDELSSIHMPAFDMTIKGLGYFPPRRHPNVIWTGIKENEMLMELQATIEETCQSVGFEPDTRSYIPHITIGRVKDISMKEVNRFFDKHKDLRIPDITVNKFVLYESKLHPDGAEHTPFRRFGLAEQSTENEA